MQRTETGTTKTLLPFIVITRPPNREGGVSVCHHTWVVGYLKPSHLGCAAFVRKPSVLAEPPSFRPSKRLGPKSLVVDPPEADRPGSCGSHDRGHNYYF